MELNYNRRSSGVAKAGLTTGIIGTSLAAMGILGGGSALLGGWGNRNNTPAQTAMDVVALQALSGGAGVGAWGRGFATGYADGTCSEDHHVNRYEAAQAARIAELETEVKLRDANTYTDQKILQLYQYIDTKLNAIDGQICQQAVINQATSDAIQLVKQERECCCARLEQAIATEKAERKCADNAIVNYSNATFYPKMIADVTTGTTTTAQALFNPVPNCGCGCSNPLA